MKELSDYRASKLKQKAEECLATVCVDPDDLLSLTTSYLAAREREMGLRRIAERLYDVVVAEANNAGTAELLKQAQEMGLDT